MSDLFVLDVDGPEAHEALLRHLGEEPVAPKAFSGSRKPYRYHLFFRCPERVTKAKATPWHAHLEFRGQGGIVVIPPSLHPSGQRYAWAPRQSPADLPLLDVPGPILAALQPQVRHSAPASVTLPAGLAVRPSTRRDCSALGSFVNLKRVRAGRSSSREFEFSKPLRSSKGKHADRRRFW